MPESRTAAWPRTEAIWAGRPLVGLLASAHCPRVGSEEIQAICRAWRQVSAVRFTWEVAAMTAVRKEKQGTAAAGAGGLVAWAEGSGR
jgi:hypothetical protein